MLQPLDTRCSTSIRPLCLTEGGSGVKNTRINKWRNNFYLAGLCKIGYQISIFLNEPSVPAQRLFCQFFHSPFPLLMRLGGGIQIFPRNHFALVAAGLGAYFSSIIWALAGIHLVFCCELSRLQQQQLWRIWWQHSVTDQTEPGPGPQRKSCAWQTHSRGIVPHGPKWTGSEVFDLLGFSGRTSMQNTTGTQGMNPPGVSFFCKGISLGYLKQLRTGLRILPLGGTVVKMGAPVLPAMATTFPSLKHRAPLPFYFIYAHCT